MVQGPDCTVAILKCGLCTKTFRPMGGGPPGQWVRTLQNAADGHRSPHGPGCGTTTAAAPMPSQRGPTQAQRKLVVFVLVWRGASLVKAQLAWSGKIGNTPTSNGRFEVHTSPPIAKPPPGFLTQTRGGGGVTLSVLWGACR